MFCFVVVGKLPATSVSDEKLEVLRKYEEEKTDNLLSKYIAFCATAKVLYNFNFAFSVLEFRFDAYIIEFCCHVDR